jgi:hypothetical protein
MQTRYEDVKLEWRGQARSRKFKVRAAAAVAWLRPGSGKQRNSTSTAQPDSPPDLDLAIQRNRARLPRDENGELFLGRAWLRAPYHALRTLGADAELYIRFVQEGILACLLATLVLVPAMFFNMGLFPPIDFEEDYGRLAADGFVTGTEPDDTWTHLGRWGGPHDCSMGEDAPLTCVDRGSNAGPSRIALPRMAALTVRGPRYTGGGGRAATASCWARRTYRGCTWSPMRLPSQSSSDSSAACSG